MADALRGGVFLPSSTREPEALLALAREAERLGFDSVWVPDNVLKVFRPILDPLTVLAFLAGRTHRIGLGTSVLVLPYRHPVLLANMAASLDVLSGGRLTLGVGAGWNEGEFSALGIGVRERGRRTDEALEALGELWGGGAAIHDGRFYSFEGAEIGTKPRAEGGPRVVVGGRSNAALRRALRFGDGWNGFGETPEEISAVRKRIAQLGEETGRDPEGLEISTVYRTKADSSDGAAEALAGELGGLAQAGVELCILGVFPADPERLAPAPRRSRRGSGRSAKEGRRNVHLPVLAASARNLDEKRRYTMGCVRRAEIPDILRKRDASPLRCRGSCLLPCGVLCYKYRKRGETRYPCGLGVQGRHRI